MGAGEILHALVRKELHVKYKRSMLGFFWSLVNPAALTAVYFFVFARVYDAPQEDFALFLITGVLPWHYFSVSVQAATNSMVDNAPMLRKVYFPRALIPLSTVAANLLNFLMGLALLCAVVAWLGRPFWTALHWLVLAVVLETALLAGVALVLSVWNLYFRDIAQLIGIALLLLFFLTPIVYDLELVPPALRGFIVANPLTAVMDLYRAALFEPGAVDAAVVWIGLGVAVVVAGFGALVFRRMSPHLAKEV